MTPFSRATLAALLAGIMLVMPVNAGKQQHRYQRNHAHHSVKHHVKKIHRRPALKPIVQAVVDISTQTMTVSVNGSFYSSWRVSTGRKGYNTPRGSFRVSRMA